MGGFDGYDAWKTASPFDDCDDEHCAYCGADLPDDVTGYTVADEGAVMDGFCNYACEENGKSGEISPRYGLPHFTDTQEARLAELQTNIFEWDRTHKTEYATLEDVVKYMPEGDFEWIGEGGDNDVFCCGEGDCQQQWHESWQREEFRRVNGKLQIDIFTGDMSGDDDISCSWWEGDDFQASGVAEALGPESMNDHFKGWARYWLDAAETGKDPCDQMMMRVHLRPGFNHIDFCLDAAADNIKYLRMTRPKPWKRLWIKIRNRIRRFIR